ncbi:hypothetical protein J4573_20370 [Actinomadura barringtoniae]|uniref:Streptogrisin B n=1 Tax=Actinomadura barringtoniae TaxID=1427535 RepID=A0A939T4I5_9ACTN|nr:S1 family peptidase [Actinomadura barringtoniae]MBO2449468.1 hypothetical protein [Actinomadura barringtoniae]
MFRTLVFLTATAVTATLATLPTTATAATAASAAFAGPRTAAVYDVRGGDMFTTAGSGGRCTIGFSVTGGYVTSGKCAPVGESTIGYNGVAQGTVAASSYPGLTSAWVRTNADWRPRGLVNRYDGTSAAVHGSTPAPVGAAACMSGPVSGWRCGTITGRNLTVSFPEGAITGLIGTNICASAGEVGAPLIANDQAQGILVGSSGSGTCTSFFIPVAQILSAYGLTLATE